MYKFKVGDKVRCINDDGIDPCYQIHKGKIYTVRLSEPPYVSFDHTKSEWVASRFELVRPTNHFLVTDLTHTTTYDTLSDAETAARKTLKPGFMLLN